MTTPGRRTPTLDPSDVRKPHGITFSDVEWEAIVQAAAAQGITPGAYVRDAALGALGFADTARRQATRSPNKPRQDEAARNGSEEQRS